MVIFLVFIALYLISGISRIISDFNQPKINQPLYIHNFSLAQMLIAFILSPLFWWEEISRPIPKENKERLRELKKLERDVDRLRKDLYR